MKIISFKKLFYNMNIIIIFDWIIFISEFTVSTS